MNPGVYYILLCFPGRGKSAILRAQAARGRGRGGPAQRGSGRGNWQNQGGSGGQQRRRPDDR